MSFFLKSIRIYTHKRIIVLVIINCRIFVQVPTTLLCQVLILRNQKMQGKSKAIIQYCMSNQSYTKVVKVATVVKDLSMQEISSVFL